MECHQLCTNHQCANSKFGCCPDGVAFAKGPRNEGCGCKDTEFGCCPGGEHAAQAENFKGCKDAPESRGGYKALKIKLNNIISMDNAQFALQFYF